MKKFLKLFGIIAFTVIMGFSLIACDERDPALEGTWRMLEGYEGMPYDHTMVASSYTFQKNGTVNNGMKWKTENNRLNIISDEYDYVRDYEISGTRLILTENGNKTVYARFPGENSAIVGTWIDIRGKEWIFNSDNRLVYQKIFGEYPYILDGNKLGIWMRENGLETYDISISADGRTLSLTGGVARESFDSGPGWSSENTLKKSQ